MVFYLHRTDTEFEDSMISKLFLFQVRIAFMHSYKQPKFLVKVTPLLFLFFLLGFQFVNSYASFFYIAFIAPYQPASPDAQDNWKGDCGAKNCMIPLAMNLAIIFGEERNQPHMHLILYCDLLRHAIGCGKPHGASSSLPHVRPEVCCRAGLGSW